MWQKLIILLVILISTHLTACAYYVDSYPINSSVGVYWGYYPHYGYWRYSPRYYGGYSPYYRPYFGWGRGWHHFH